VNTYQINSELVGEHLNKIAGELYFGIGEVEMSANREELKYTDRTKEALVEKLNALVDEFIAHTMGTIESSEFTPWEKRLRAQILNQLELPIPKQWKEITDHSVKIEYLGLDFTLIHNKSPSTRISVEAGTRILIDDTGKELVGYHLTFNDWVMRPAEKQTVEWARGRLDEALAKAGLTGVNIQLLSTIPWTAPYKPPKKVANPKHKVSTFKLVPNAIHKSPWSNCWTVEKRIPTKNDVFVVVRNFKAYNYKHFFEEYSDDRKMCSHFGGFMPEVYGYKSTEKKPVDPSKIEGTPYEKWRVGLAQRLLTQEIIELIDATHWSDLDNDSYASIPGKTNLLSLITKLGEKHPIVDMFVRQEMNTLALRTVSQGRREALADLARRTGRRFQDSEARKACDKIYRTYPLLELSRITCLWDYRNGAKWIDYVKMVDSHNALMFSAIPRKHDGAPGLNGHATTTPADEAEFDF
jgi:hypothetical protein